MVIAGIVIATLLASPAIFASGLLLKSTVIVEYVMLPALLQ